MAKGRRQKSKAFEKFILDDLDRLDKDSKKWEGEKRRIDTVMIIVASFTRIPNLNFPAHSPSALIQLHQVAGQLI